MLKEACVENFTNLTRAIAAGADRVELNSDLDVGGITPSFGVLKSSIEFAHNKNVPVVVMIRPRGDDFVYNDDEIKIMVNDIQIVSMLKADAVTFGCLTTSKELDKVRMLRLLSLTDSLKMPVVMHMAFDEIKREKQHDSLMWLASHGVCRILTHGGNLDQPIDKNLTHLQEIITWADHQIEILPGGGITSNNFASLATKLKVSQMHGTKIVSMI